jgi:hypothetical protein
MRHYFKNRLKNPNQRLLPDLPSVWDLPPYEVARFGGELSKIILEAVQNYIIQKGVLQQKTLFNAAAFQEQADSNSNHPGQP